MIRISDRALTELQGVLNFSDLPLFFVSFYVLPLRFRPKIWMLHDISIRQKEAKKPARDAKFPQQREREGLNNRDRVWESPTEIILTAIERREP